MKRIINKPLKALHAFARKTLVLLGANRIHYVYIEDDDSNTFGTFSANREVMTYLLERLRASTVEDSKELLVMFSSSLTSREDNDLKYDFAFINNKKMPVFTDERRSESVELYRNYVIETRGFVNVVVMPCIASEENECFNYRVRGELINDLLYGMTRSALESIKIELCYPRESIDNIHYAIVVSDDTTALWNRGDGSYGLLVRENVVVEGLLK